jgi:hypothetical protein
MADNAVTDHQLSHHQSLVTDGSWLSVKDRSQSGTDRSFGVVRVYIYSGDLHIVEYIYAIHAYVFTVYSFHASRNIFLLVHKLKERMKEQTVTAWEHMIM